MIAKADAIRRLATTIVADAIAIGGHLREAKALLKHGQWYPWLKREFDWNARQAQRFMNLHELGQKRQFVGFDV